jgi:hypothetical protein
MSLVALIGALILMTRPFTSRKTKDLFRAVDVELILYMTATMLMAQAMTDTGADRWLATRAMSALPSGLLASGPGVAVALSVIAVMAHLAIASRSARAAILIPAVALPMAGLGHDATLMILIAVMGTGFCQTLMSSAKPVAIYGLRDEAGFTQADLLRLALPLGVVKTGLLVAFAILVWPHQTTTHRASIEEPGPSAALTADMVRALSVVPDMAPLWAPADPGMVIAQSPRPPLRPDGLGTQAATADTGKPVRNSAQKTAARTTVGGQFAQDLKQARRQIARDLNRLFN